MPKAHPLFDIVIVGSGLVGASLALALRNTPLKIAVIDSRAPSANDPRLLALNASSCQFLANIGIWPDLASHATAIKQVHVSYRGHFGAVRLNHDDVALPNLGHVIPAYQIEAALQQALCQTHTLYQPARLLKITQDMQEARLQLQLAEEEITIAAKVVIGADGAESTVRKEMQVTADVFDYAQSALVTRTTLQRSHHQIAYERFTANGAIAMLPLKDLTCATIWTADHATIHELSALDDAQFLQKLQTEFGYRLGKLKQVSTRHVFPLRMVRAHKMLDQHIILLGNSAHSLHPIAAQGFNLALYEVAALVECILNKIRCAQMISAADLQVVVAQVAKQQSAGINLSHQLAQLADKNRLAKTMLVPLGLMGIDVLTPFKKQFIEKVLGRSGRVPRLLLAETG